jgi:hypothetical protein
MILLTDITNFDIIRVSAEGITFIAALYLVFSKSYLQEKGKNLATKEDISEITKTVEAIKTELAFSGQLKFSIKTEERAAVLDCYIKYHLWLSTLMNFTIPSDFDDINDQINKDNENLNKIYFDFITTVARVELYIPKDTGLSTLLRELRVQALAIEHLTQMLVINFNKAKSIYNIRMDNSLSNEVKLTFISDFKDEKMVLFEEYSKKRIELYRGNFEKAEHFKELCYKLLIEYEK